MGSNLDYYFYRGTKEDLPEYHDEYQAELGYQDGSDSYAGHLGAIKHGIDFADVKPFKDAESAKDYLEEHHSKWACAMAVPYRGKVLDYDVKSKQVINQMKRAEEQLRAVKTRVLKQIKSRKSKNIGCKSCASSIARTRLLDASCPICKKVDIFYSETQKKAIKAKEDKLTELKKLTLKKVDKPGVCYIVGAWCPS